MSYQVETEHSTNIKEKTQPEVKNPPLYKVILLNDDFTPMDFVVEILKQFFFMNGEKAVQVMMEVHTKGKGICGIFTRDVAETKVDQVNNYSRLHEYPLLCTMEMV
jgi:ATP-dependent Clp protease adaptor protein ClpS